MTKRKQKLVACGRCRKAHTACSLFRPCRRCSRLDRMCYDVEKVKVKVYLQIPVTDVQYPTIVDLNGNRICSLEDIEGPSVKLALTKLL